MDPRRQVAAGLLALLAAVSPALVSCSSDDEDPPPTTTEAATVEDVLADSSAAMAQVDFVAFRLESSGAEVTIEGAGPLGFQSAEGHYAAPSSADAVVRVTALGLRTQVAARAIDGQVWITNPLSGRWETAPEGLSFDPAVLFDPERGLPAALRDGLEDPRLVDTDDRGRHHVQGTLSAERVASLTGGLVEQATTVDLWIDAATHHVVEVRFDVDVGDDTSSWVLVLDEYGEPVTIEAPEPGSEP